MWGCCALAHRRIAVAVFDVFDRDCRLVDKHSYDEGKTSKRHDVDRIRPEPTEQAERQGSTMELRSK
jgi:hypothetical protein